MNVAYLNLLEIINHFSIFSQQDKQIHVHNKTENYCVESRKFYIWELSNTFMVLGMIYWELNVTVKKLCFITI